MVHGLTLSDQNALCVCIDELFAPYDNLFPWVHFPGACFDFNFLPGADYHACKKHYEAEKIHRSGSDRAIIPSYSVDENSVEQRAALRKDIPNAFMMVQDITDTIATKLESLLHHYMQICVDKQKFRSILFGFGHDEDAALEDSQEGRVPEGRVSCSDSGAMEHDEDMPVGEDQHVRMLEGGVWCADLGSEEHGALFSLYMLFHMYRDSKVRSAIEKAFLHREAYLIERECVLAVLQDSLE